MIRKNIKIVMQTLAILLIIVFSITSCANPTEQEGSKSSSAPEASGSSSEAEVKEPVTLTILGPTFEKAFPNGIQEDEIAKAIAEETGVTLDWTIGNGISDFDVYQNTLLASNDFTDIVYTINGDNVFRQKIMTAGAALPLDDLLASNGKNILENAADMVRVSKAFKSDTSNSLYFLGTNCSDDGRVPGNLQGISFIRWDLYKAIGSPQITTEAELLSSLKTMQEQFPTNADGKKAYAMSGFFGDWGNVMPGRVYEKAMGYNSVGAANSVYYNSLEANGETIDGYSLESPFIKGAKFYNKAYQEGLLDPDAFTMKFEQFLDKVKAGRVYYSSDNWTCYDVYNPEAQKAGLTDSGFAPIWYLLGTPENPKGASYEYSPAGAYDFWINKNCSDPDRAIDLFDYLFTFEGSELVLNGIKGEHWDIVDGEPQLKESVLSSEASDPEFRVTTGVYKYQPLAGFAGTAKDEDGFAVNFRSNMKIKAKSLTDFEKSLCADVGELIPGEKFITKLTGRLDLTIQSSMSYGDDSTLTDIANKLNEYKSINYIKLLTPKSDAEWETAYNAYVEGAKALGYEQFRDEIMKRVKNMADQLNAG